MARVMVRLCITRHPTFETVACVKQESESVAAERRVNGLYLPSCACACKMGPCRTVAMVLGR